jgi:hypothetical protein
MPGEFLAVATQGDGDRRGGGIDGEQQHGRTA